MFSEHGEEPLGRQVDDALPVTAADAEGAGAADEFEPEVPALGWIALIISDTAITPLAVDGPIIPAMTGSRSPIVMAR